MGVKKRAWKRIKASSQEEDENDLDFHAKAIFRTGPDL
jgi:hypothetical protein